MTSFAKYVEKYPIEKKLHKLCDDEWNRTGFCMTCINMFIKAVYSNGQCHYTNNANTDKLSFCSCGNRYKALVNKVVEKLGEGCFSTDKLYETLLDVFTKEEERQFYSK